MRHIGTWVDDYWDKSPEPDFETPYESLDKIIGGFSHQHLTILAARPAMGKTAMGLDIASFTALELNRPVAIFEAEMPGHQVLSRLSMQLSGGNPRSESAKETILQAPIYLNDSASPRPSDIRKQVEKYNDVSQDRIEQVVVDYLQLVQPPPGDHENRDTAIGAIMREFKALAKELECHLLLLCQLNRGPERRHQEGGDARPSLSDLRESGNIEQDAYEVLFIYRPDYYRPFKQHDGVTELIVAKNRDGSVGTARTTFIPEEQRFEG